MMPWDALLHPALVLVGAGAAALAWRLALAGLRAAAARPGWLVGGVAAAALALLGFLARGHLFGQAHLVAGVAILLGAALAGAVLDAHRWWRSDRRVDVYDYRRRQISRR